MALNDPNNHARYWCDKHTPGLSLMCADFTDHDFSLHSHEALVVAATEYGGAIVKSRGATLDVTPAALCVFNPAEPHAGWMGKSRRWRYRAFYLARPAIEGIAAALGAPALTYFRNNMIADGALIDSFLGLHRALEAEQDQFGTRELLLGTFGRLFQRYGSGKARIAPPPRDQAVLRKVTEVMRARYAESLHLDALAAAAELTPFQLIGLFKRATGLTAHAYLTQIRLSAACRLLRRGAAIADAASASGFYDQSALTNTFKRSYGITPGQFARAAQM